VDSSSAVEMPGNLLKIKDLQSTYSELIKFAKLNEDINAHYIVNQKNQDELFKEQEEKVNKIEWITII
jgi:hypothetical protein